MLLMEESSLSLPPHYSRSLLLFVLSLYVLLCCPIISLLFYMLYSIILSYPCMCCGTVLLLSSPPFRSFDGLSRLLYVLVVVIFDLCMSVCQCC